jgi:hypothetical protein
MALETLIKAVDLDQWASRLEARSRLPLLLRRLIHATTDNVQRIGFPADEGVQAPGYDGFLVVEKGNAFVPDGCSVWEMGANKDIKGKADDDYDKRRTKPLEVDPAITTFVFVTPRRWNNKTDWIAEKKKDGVWFDVRVYDADDLEQWLELAPSVHIWISILLGKHPKTAEDITSFWESWSGATQPPLSPQILTVGRENIMGQFDNWLAAGATVLTFKADTQEEAIAFFAAFLYQKPIEERILWLSRVLLVDDLETLNQLSTFENKLIVVPRFNPANNVGRAIQNGHSVLVPLGKGDSSSQATIELPRQHVGQIKEALLGLVLKEERAQSLAALARRSLMAFRRKLATHPELHEPIWSQPEHAREIVPALLIGQWNDTNEGDRAALAKLANLSYENYIAVLGRWANESDPPVRHVGNIWFLTSKEDAWNLLSRYVNFDDTKRLESLVLEVLSEVNPSLDLPINERWAAALHGKVLSFSENLREGIADTLAIVGAESGVAGWSQSTSPQEYVDRVVYKLFNTANADWKIWSSLSSILRLLAEASPSHFLDAVDKAVSGSSPVLLNLFEEPESALFSGAAYPGLLSALELLAWSPNYLSRVAVILATLARLDPGGKLGNRPSNSLKAIFLIWFPETTASLQQRLQVIDMLRKRENAVAWALMNDILYRPNAISLPSTSPRWRDWVPDSRLPVTWREIWDATHELVAKMLEDVGCDGNRWKTLIENLGSLPKEEADEVILNIEKIDLGLLKSDDHAIIWAALRNLVAHHMRFLSAQWAMPGEVVNRLNQIYERFAPDDLITLYAWLFGNRTELIGDFANDWQAHEQAVATARVQAIKEILGKGGVLMLIEMIEKVEQPYYLGLALGQMEIPSQDEGSLLSLLNDQNNYHKGFLSGFVLMRQKTLGWDWVQRTMDDALRPNFTQEQQSEFFAYLPCATQTWKALESFGVSVQEKYWLTVRPRSFDVDDFTLAIQKLLDHGRPHVALDIITMHIDKIGLTISAAQTIDCLEMTVRTKPEHEGEWRLLDYIDDLLNAVEKTGEISESRLASLEFSLLPVLSYRGERGPRFLRKELSRNPDFFIEVLCLVYRAEGAEKRNLSEDERTKAQFSSELLHEWNLIPGLEDGGVINSAVLKGWVQKARELSVQNKRVKVSDRIIGQVFSYSPKESDGSWPAVPIRDLIEGINSDEINRGFIMGVSNRRGVTSRGLLDGGAQERDLAEQYKGYAAAIRDLWPRTASVLDKIAKNYLSDAHREDLGAELEEDSWQ